MVFEKGNIFGKMNKGRIRLDAKERMKENNPMNNIENIEKMKNTVNEKIKSGWIHTGRFFKGMIGTNTDKKFTKEHKEKIRKSMLGKNKGKFSDEKNPKWKGDEVGYVALHSWIKRKIKKPKKCFVCSSDKYKIELANISKRYKRDLNDWIYLCKSCHTKFDKKPKYTSEYLINFEEKIVRLYKQGLIKSPIHLSGGDEYYKIKSFGLIDRKDIIYSTYRSHYDALLHGIKKDWLIDWILQNKSIHVMHKNPDIRTSAIVGGILSQAIGSALAIKMKKENRKVWCMIGDMTATTGIFWECYNYSINYDLPIVFVISDNGLSTDTPTKEVWGMKETDKHWFEERPYPKIIYYKYKRRWPHYGIGEFIEFKEGKDDGKSF